MNNTGLELIALRQRRRSMRDLAFACAMVLLVTFGLGAISTSAGGADFGPADRSAQSR